ncbi:MAG: DNA polymerase/3'-5' exonuclease PolX [Saprospiraceae bacterium]|nr:DNA polymerase/3'-5' exonuclease PolX [Saprospiraceae bacterium]
MTNKEIAKAFQMLGKVMELHGENKFKIRSYANAYITLRKLQEPLSSLQESEISAIKGVGKAISTKIIELLETGEMQTLQKYLKKTPPGIVELLSISGFGPKKVKTVWDELGVESVGELLYAVNENRLIELKGFGEKTQDDLRQKLLYYQRTRNQFHYATLEVEAPQVLNHLATWLPDNTIELTGAIRRAEDTLTGIDIVVDTTTLPQTIFSESLTLLDEGQEMAIAVWGENIQVRIHLCTPETFGTVLFKTSAHPDFLDAFPLAKLPATADEKDVFTAAGLSYLEPELRMASWNIELAKAGHIPTLIQEQDIRGVIHSHSTYSDGIHTLREMAEYTRDQGYEYLVITDHSKSAFYANGLQPERVQQQWAEIDQLNQELAPFRIFKGIESDILNDGSLDYDEEMLAGFDVVIASIHTNLRMDETKATDRLLKAIAHPRTNMLGHPTGRLLLSREGYPIDHQKVIDACAEHKVAIELNANPYRLDLDWSWIPYALEKGVLISINPDAHSIKGIHDIRYGVKAARKGGLDLGKCLNSKGLNDFSLWLTRR